MSIETKTERSSEDPLIQLGIWTAAWHKRLCCLQSEVQRRRGLPPTEQRLVTVPLIQAVGHNWDLYFACFGASITLYGTYADGLYGHIVRHVHPADLPSGCPVMGPNNILQRYRGVDPM